MASFSILCPGDELIQRLVPQYGQIVDLMVQLVSATHAPRSVLDLGTGPGRIAEVIHQRFPQARLTLLDASQEVLEIARRRLATAAPRSIVGDYTVADLGQGYDAIIAGLTLHHLDDQGKKAMLVRLWDALAPGGLLVVSDIVRGTTPNWDRWYEETWLGQIAEVAETHPGVVPHYREHDHPARVEDQLQWLQQAGFVEVACHWRHLNFAVFTGRRPGPTSPLMPQPRSSTTTQVPSDYVASHQEAHQRLCRESPNGAGWIGDGGSPPGSPSTPRPG